MFIGANSGVNVKIGGKLYPIESLLEKSVYARIKTPIWRYPSEKDGKSKYVFNPGQFIGKVFSWVTRTDGIYLMFEWSKGSPYLKDFPSGSYYVKVADIDENTIKQQGVKDAETQAKEEQEKQEKENETTADKLSKTVLKLGLGIAAIFALSNFAGKAISR